MGDRDKGAEILAPRHRLSVLQRQLGSRRVTFTVSDRVVMAALLHRISRRVLVHLHLLIRPDAVFLHREVFEETGLRLSLLSPLCWLKWDRHRSGASILVAFYVAHVATPDEVRFCEEHTEYRWVTMEEFEHEQLAVSAEREIVSECFALSRQSQSADR